MEIKINDTPVALPDGSSLAQALDYKNIIPKDIAVAVNGKVVPLKEISSFRLNDGDSVMIIKAFYGG